MSRALPEIGKAMANWNFEDFLRRLEAIKGIGSIDELVEHVPGLGQILREVDFKLEELDPIEQILRAMTLEERLRPELLDGDNGDERRERIAYDAASTREAVDSLIAQFEKLRDLLRERSPEDVLRDTIQQQQAQDGGGEAWQTPADAWKAEDGFPIKDEDPSEDEEGEEEADDLELEIVKEPSPSLSERLDDILRKISASGMPSLNEEEREFLHEASQAYRNRRERR